MEAKATAEVIDWLHQAWELKEKGHALQPDPFYERNEIISENIVIASIDALEKIFINELEKYPGYHNQAQGIEKTEYLVSPGFNKLPYSQQRAIVIGIDKILQPYREKETLSTDSSSPS